MPSDLDRDLTERQRAVLDGIDRRLPLKAVAAELGISESRVNQHVRTLKELFGVHSLPDLVDAWRGSEGGEGAGRPAIGDHIPPADPCRNPAWRNPELPPPPPDRQDEGRVAPGEFVLSDSAFFSAIEAPWTRNDPRDFPGVLDGRNAVLLRLAVIVGLALGIIAAIVLVVTASLSLGEAMDGTAGLAPKSSVTGG